MYGTLSEVDRRAFLERMASLSTTAMISPTLLGSQISNTRPAGTQTNGRYTGKDIKLPQIQVRQVTDLTNLTIVEAATLIRRGEISPIELTHAYLRQIDRWEGVYQAFNTILYESALESARNVNPQRDHPLAGIPLAIKDNFFTAGVFFLLFCPPQTKKSRFSREPPTTTVFQKEKCEKRI